MTLVLTPEYGVTSRSGSLVSQTLSLLFDPLFDNCSHTGPCTSVNSCTATTYIVFSLFDLYLTDNPAYRRAENVDCHNS